MTLIQMTEIKAVDVDLSHNLLTSQSAATIVALIAVVKRLNLSFNKLGT